MSILLIISLFSFGEIPFEITEGCYPFHHSLGNPVYIIDEGAYALPCEKLADNHRDASTIWSAQIRNHFETYIVGSHGVSMHNFRSLDGSPIPKEFYYHSYQIPEKMPYQFAISNEGILFVVWYNKECKRAWNSELSVSMIKCNE